MSTSFSQLFAVPSFSATDAGQEEITHIRFRSCPLACAHIRLEPDLSPWHSSESIARFTGTLSGRLADNHIGTHLLHRVPALVPTVEYALQVTVVDTPPHNAKPPIRIGYLPKQQPYFIRSMPPSLIRSASSIFSPFPKEHRAAVAILTSSTHHASTVSPWVYHDMVLCLKYNLACLFQPHGCPSSPPSSVPIRRVTRRDPTLPSRPRTSDNGEWWPSPLMHAESSLVEIRPVRARSCTSDPSIWTFWRGFTPPRVQRMARSSRFFCVSE